jgi:diguanylate cyclase (GGDEF)-like protein/PAS domain S-box-containing protein
VRLSRLAPLGAVVAVVVHAAASPRGRLVWFAAVACVAYAMVLAGIRLHRPDRARGWSALALGMGIFAVLAVLEITLRQAVGPLPGPLTGAILAAAAFGVGAMGWGCFSLLRLGSVRVDREVLLDALLLAAIVAYPVWELMVRPRQAPSAADAVYAGLALAEVTVLLVLALRALVSASRRTPSFWYLAGGLASGMVALVPSGTAGISWADDPRISLATGIALLLAGAAALHPTMANPLSGTRPGAAGLGSQVWITAVALLAVPTVSAVEATQQTVRPVALAGVGTFVTVLALARLWAAVTERQRAERTLAEREARFSSLVRHAYDPVVVVEAGRRVTYCSPAAETVLGFGPEHYVASDVLDHVHPDDTDLARAGLAQALGRPGAVARFELRVAHADGTVRSLDVTAAAARDRTEVVLNLHDVTDRKRAAEDLSRMALYDALTGLPNRHLLHDRLSHALARAARQDRTVAVVFIDLDRFKVVNDSLGHETGDRLLVQVAERLAAGLGEDDTLARFGGDEFVVVSEDVDDEAAVVATAGRLLDALADPFVLGTATVHAAASAGIALGGETATPETMLRDADAAAHRAKERGRGRVELFDDAIRRRAVQRLETEAALREALGRNEFRLHYQPVFSAADGSVQAIEALLRWQHPGRGLVGPAEFVPLAEESGLIVPIGTWVIEQALRDLARSGARTGAPLGVAVNLSARQLHQGDLAYRVLAAAARAGLDPARLTVEITESVLVDDPESTAAVLDRLRAMGVRVSVDDFGTGYSSLTYLRRLPVDVLKIDRSFVAGLGRGGQDVAIVAAVVDMAKALGLEVVAEGVETAEQLEVLTSLGCDLVQGFHLARPLPLDELVARLGAPALQRPLAVGE